MKPERWMVDYEHEEGQPQHAVLSWIDDEASELPEIGTYLIRERDVIPAAGWDARGRAADSDSVEIAVRALCMYRTGDPRRVDEFRRDVEIVAQCLQRASKGGPVVPSDKGPDSLAPRLNGPGGSPNPSPARGPAGGDLWDALRIAVVGFPWLDDDFEAEDLFDRELVAQAEDQSGERESYPTRKGLDLVRAVLSDAPVRGPAGNDEAREALTELVAALDTIHIGAGRMALQVKQARRFFNARTAARTALSTGKGDTDG